MLRILFLAAVCLHSQLSAENTKMEDLTELEGRWYTQSYWQDKDILQKYTFSQNAEDKIAGKASVQVGMQVAAERPNNTLEVRFEFKNPVDLSQAEALEVSLMAPEGFQLKPRDVFLCNPGFKKLTIARWPGNIDLSQAGKWQRAVIDLLDARVLDKARPGVNGEYSRKDVATVCFNFTLPKGAVDSTIRIDGFRPVKLPPPLVTREERPDGSFLFTSANYRVIVDSRGYLRSIRAGKTEFLKTFPVAVQGETQGQDKAAVASGFFPDNKPGKGLLPLGKPRPVGRSGLRASGELASLQYIFRENDFDILVQQKFTRAGHLFFGLSSEVLAGLDGRTDRPVRVKKRESGYQIDTRLVTRSGGVLVCKQYVVGYARLSLGPLDKETYALRFLSYGSGRNRLTLRPVGAPTAPDAIGFKIEAPNADFLLPGGEPLQFKLAATNYGPRPVQGNFTFQVCDYLFRKALKQKVTPFKLGPGESIPVPTGVYLEEPGTYRAKVLVSDGGASRSVDWNFVYDFPNYRPELKSPADFHEFWKETLEELSQVPMDARLTPVPEVNTPEMEAFKVSLATLGGRRVYCWYWKPRKAGKYPARFELPSSGVYPRKANQVPRRPDMCGMWMAIHGLPVDYDPKDPPKDPVAWNYWTHGIEGPRTSMWRTIFASLVRGVDFLCSREEVDSRRIAAGGGSQGGGLTLVLAGLDKRISAAFPAHSGLARLDWTVLYGPGFWPFRMQAKPAGQSTEQFLKTLSYFDMANFTPDIQCPVVAEVSLLDTVTASGNQICALSHLKPGQLELICDPWNSHSSSPRGARLRSEAFTRWLQGKPPVKHAVK